MRRHILSSQGFKKRVYNFFWGGQTGSGRFQQERVNGLRFTVLSRVANLAVFLPNVIFLAVFEVVWQEKNGLAVWQLFGRFYFPRPTPRFPQQFSCFIDFFKLGK